MSTVNRGVKEGEKKNTRSQNLQSRVSAQCYWLRREVLLLTQLLHRVARRLAPVPILLKPGPDPARKRKSTTTAFFHHSEVCPSLTPLSTPLSAPTLTHTSIFLVHDAFPGSQTRSPESCSRFYKVNKTDRSIDSPRFSPVACFTTAAMCGPT